MEIATDSPIYFFELLLRVKTNSKVYWYRTALYVV